MKRSQWLICIGLIGFACIISLLANCPWVYGKEGGVGDENPFQKLEELAKKQWGGWDGNQADLSKEFNAERARLGPRFEKELMAFLGDDIKRHEKIANYISDGTPHSCLAICIYEQGIVLCRRAKGQDSDAELVTLSMIAAVECEKAGFHGLAWSHKKEAEASLKDQPILAGACPVMLPEESRLYESISDTSAKQSP